MYSNASVGDEAYEGKAICARNCASTSPAAICHWGCVAWPNGNSLMRAPSAGLLPGRALLAGLDGFLRHPGGHVARRVDRGLRRDVLHRGAGDLLELLRERAPPLHRVDDARRRL